jgi:hypothetical protein
MTPPLLVLLVFLKKCYQFYLNKEAKAINRLFEEEKDEKVWDLTDFCEGRS